MEAKKAALEALSHALDQMDEAVTQFARPRARTRSKATWRQLTRPLARADALFGALKSQRLTDGEVSRIHADGEVRSPPRSPARSPVRGQAKVAPTGVRQSASSSTLAVPQPRTRRLSKPGGVSAPSLAASRRNSPVASRNTSRLASNNPSPRSNSPMELEENSISVARAHLRNALEHARTLGVGDANEVVVRAQESLSEWEQKLKEVRAEVKQVVVDWESMNASDMEMWSLKEVEDRLAVVIMQARAFGLEERELVAADTQRRRIHNVIEDLKGQVRVYCRVRPLSQKEVALGEDVALQAVDTMTLEGPHGMFSFDALFAPGSQEEVFDNCKDLVQSAVDGHNVTIFAYGQTGAGKTYTMYGTPKEEGIAARTISELYRILDVMNNSFRFRVYASMVELYNNTLIDLLRPLSAGQANLSIKDIPKLTVRYDHAGNPIIDSLCEKIVQDAPELKALLDSGLRHRTVATTAMNIESSRSHLLFFIKVLSTNRQTGEVLSGKILLCDLGGSERLKKSESAGQQQKEAIEINRSLTALGDVIEAIAAKQKVVPYRNHKLTQVMQDSLGGTAKTLMFVNCSPAYYNLNETVMSLMWAARAKKVTNSGMPASTPALIPQNFNTEKSPLHSPQATRRGSPLNSVLPSPK